MSYTNQTQHYGLPQYVATDIPAYLTDYNQAMATIDQGMNAAKTQAESAATAAGQATNDITALQSTVNTQAAQISAAAQGASAAQTTANSADGKADVNAQNIAGLDARVTAIEEGGSAGESVVSVDVTKNATFSAFSGMYRNVTTFDAWLEGVLPIGKTVNDLLSILCVNGSAVIGASLVNSLNINLYALTATAQNVTLRFTFK